MTEDASWEKLRGAFFKMAYGNHSGYVCIALLKPNTRDLTEEFFSYPAELPRMLAYIEDNYKTHNVYYCPQLLNFKRRIKSNVKYCTVLWADLEGCVPEHLLVPPSVVVESSPGRYQALWSTESPLPAADAELLSKRIAYYHAQHGADKSGWDLTQLLRVPLTYNFKYEQPVLVRTRPINLSVYRPDDFAAYPVTFANEGLEIPVPSSETMSQFSELKPEEFINSKRLLLGQAVVNLWSTTPTHDWSGQLWRFLMGCFEAGLSLEETYWLAGSAACNKYARDNRDEVHLWGDVCRAYVKHRQNTKTIIIPELNTVKLLSEEETSIAKERYSFVEEYIEWASNLGDAAKQYHQAGAFTVLSSLLAGRVVLPTSFGTLLPNLWFMLLADTTLTRKSTAMDIAMDLLIEVDPDCIMTTDGSLEGLMQGMSTRPGRPSIFLRDEFTGLLEAMTRKDYMAGMPEMLTKLYDGKMQKRLLRKETIEVRKPVLIIFAGGIKAKTQQLLTLEHISSGFMPRFVFLTAESDASKVLPMGPPITRDLTGRSRLLDKMTDMYTHYTTTPKVDGGINLNEPVWFASLTPAAWKRFNQFETVMLKAGVASSRPEVLTPVYDRLGKSVLKCAVLLAAARELGERVVVEVEDIIHAISYGIGWREYAIDIINGVGKNATEREIDKMLSFIERHPGASRSMIMQRFALSARNADALFATMEQRGLILITKNGRGMNFTAMSTITEQNKVRAAQKAKEGIPVDIAG